MVTFSCGCIGFAIVPTTPGHEHKRLILWVCDSDGMDSAVGMHWRNMGDEAATPLDDADMLDITAKVGSLVYDGHRFRELRSLLGVK